MNELFFAHFPSRLKDERLRLRLNQAQAAELCGVRREAWGQYEKGAVAPGSPVLMRFCEAGADACYLMTGNRGISASLTEKEAALLESYRCCSETTQETIEKVVFQFELLEDGL